MSNDNLRGNIKFLITMFFSEMNVVPDEFTLGFDFRVTPKTNLDQFEDMLRQWERDVSFSNFFLHFSQF